MCCLAYKYLLFKQFSKHYYLLHISAVQFPISEKLTVDDIYDRRTGKPKTDILKEHFIKEGRVHEDVCEPFVYLFTSIYLLIEH